jgi:hypothetical protein
MGFFEFGHEFDEMFIKGFSLFQKVDSFPNEHFNDKISNRFGLDVVAEQFDVI